MKKLLLAAIFSMSIAHAETSNVEIYGLMDLGIVNVSGAGSQNGKSTSVNSGTTQTSRLGFRSTEKTSANLKFGFDLEASIFPNDGSTGLNPSTGTNPLLFNRKADIFVESAVLGKITVGRQTNPFAEVAKYGDVNGARSIGSLANFILDGSTFGGTATSKTGLNGMTGGSFLSSTVRYDTPIINGFRGLVSYSMSGQVDNETAGSKTILGGMYKAGQYAAAVAYMGGKNSVGAASIESYTSGASYTLHDNTKIGVGYSMFSNPSIEGKENSKYNMYELTGALDIIQNVVANAEYTVLNDRVTSNNKSKLWSVGLDYLFSKRTTAYLMVSHITNSGANGFAAYSGGPANLNSLAGSSNFPAIVGNAGQSQTATALGVIHYF